MYCCSLGYQQLVTHLIQKVQLDINQTNLNGDSALHLAARGNFVSIFKILSEKGASLTTKNIWDETPAALQQLMVVAPLEVSSVGTKKSSKPSSRPRHTDRAYTENSTSPRKKQQDPRKSPRKHGNSKYKNTTREKATSDKTYTPKKDEPKNGKSHRSPRSQEQSDGKTPDGKTKISDSGKKKSLNREDHSATGDTQKKKRTSPPPLVEEENGSNDNFDRSSQEGIKPPREKKTLTILHRISSEKFR